MPRVGARQRVARTVLRARAAQLSPAAPPGLRSRIAANERSAQAPVSPKLGESVVPGAGGFGRLSAFAAAAMVVLTLGAVLLPIATVRSTAVLAAQMALDHLKCFTIEGGAGSEIIPKEQAEATLKQEFDFDVSVPPSLAGDELELLGVRRCLYGDGRAAHLITGCGEPVSLFVIPGLAQPRRTALFGHDQIVWTQGERTYMLVARGGLRSDLSRVASYLRNEAK